MSATPPRQPWRPPRRRRQAKLTEPLAILLTPRMRRSVGQAAALYGMSISSFVRAALVKQCDAAHSIRPAVETPEEGKQ